MKDSENINIDSIGEVKIRISKRARHLSIRIKPFIGVVVTVPLGMPISRAKKFITEKREWIIAHKQKMESFEKTYTIFDEHSNFAIRRHVLNVKRTHGGKVTVRLHDRMINADIPISKDIRSMEIQNRIRDGITAAMRKEAKDYLPNRLFELSNKFGLAYNKLFIKNISSRWGSCSAKNNINLSLHLMMLPDHLIDYVILHELAHTKVKNHSKEFWAYLNKLVPNAKTIDKELNIYKINHY